LREFLKLYWLDIQNGSSSLDVSGGKKFTENIVISSSLSNSVTSQTFNLKGEFKTQKRGGLQFGYLSRKFRDDAEEDISDIELKLVYRRPLF